jgi:RNA polymerase sigma-70 factor (ECF subfamily)
MEGTIDPLDALLAKEDAREACRIIDRLPVEQSSLLRLRYLKELSYEELADLYAIPVGTVKSRINRGRREIRKRYVNG